MLDDISKSIKATLYERVTSPLSGAFAISWAAWNYKIILVVFSSLSVKEKISFIDNVLYPDIWSIVLIGFTYPFVSAVIFILIYPFPAGWMYEYWSNSQKKLKDIKQKIEGDTLLTVEESREIRRQIFKLESEYDIEVNRKNSEIELLKNENGDLKSEESRLRRMLAKFGQKTMSEMRPSADKIEEISTSTSNDLNNDGPSKEQTKIMLDIAENDGVLFDNDYLENASMNKTELEYYLEDLELKGYVKRETLDFTDDYKTTFTTKGKRFVVDSSNKQE